MKLLLDPSAVERFVQISAARYGSVNRMYYVTRQSDDRLAIVRADCGGLIHLKNQVVDASVGDDTGTPGFVLAENEGKRHSKFTLWRVLHDTRAEIALSELLRRAPRK